MYPWQDNNAWDAVLSKYTTIYLGKERENCITGQKYGQDFEWEEN